MKGWMSDRRREGSDRLIKTAAKERWVREAGREATG